MGLAVGIIAAATGIYGAISGAVAQHKAGQAQAEAGTAEKEAAFAQADLADYNAGTMRLQAKDAIARGAEEENRFRTAIRGTIGTQRAEIAANNVDVGFGSAVDVQADAAFLGELDALTIRTNAAREAWGFDVQAEDLTRRATIARKTGVFSERAGQSARTAANYGAAGTLIGGASSLLMQQYGFSNAKGGHTSNAYVTSPYSGYGVLQ